MKISSVSRRNWVRNAGLGAATIWVPRNARGYTAAEMQAKASDSRVSVGVSKWELDTPALCVNLDKLEQNIATLQKAMAKEGIASRPHAKTHKCPAIAKLQVAGGSIGVCTAKVGEAEALFAGGVQNILMTTANVTPTKIARAMKLRKANPHFIQAVDNPQNAQDLSDAAKQAGLVADVVVDVAVMSRTGVPPDERALALSQLADRLPNLKLRGLISYDGSSQHIKGFKERLEKGLARFQPSVATFEAMKRSGLNTQIFSGGGTGTYNIMHKAPGFTDVQVGSYIFMDCQYIEIGGQQNEQVYDDFAPSLTVLATVINNYWPNRLTTDGGAKAFTLNKPGPSVVGEPGFTYNASSDEFGMISYASANRTYKVGDKLEMIVPHCDPVVNLYDQMYGIRKDRVEVIWPISARGHSQ